MGKSDAVMLIGDPLVPKAFETSIPLIRPKVNVKIIGS